MLSNYPEEYGITGIAHPIWYIVLQQHTPSCNYFLSEVKRMRLLLCLALLGALTLPAHAQKEDWLPITPEEMQLKEVPGNPVSPIDKEKVDCLTSLLIDDCRLVWSNTLPTFYGLAYDTINRLRERSVGLVDRNIQ